MRDLLMWEEMKSSADVIEELSPNDWVCGGEIVAVLVGWNGYEIVSVITFVLH